jgi:stearoyl-CoA desaturase (delta-9 desaturase)
MTNFLKKFDLVNLTFISLTPFAAIALVIFWIQQDGFQWGQVLMGILFYMAAGMSITAGYHRLFSHKAYDCHPLIKFFYLCFGAGAFQNSILKWGSDHRLHHQKVDSDTDPYNIKEGFWYAHVGWIVVKKNSEVKDRYAKDFYADRMIMWQHKFYIPLAIFTGFILPAICGELFFHSWLGGLAVAGFARVVMLHHSTFFINSLCHYIGTTPYTDTNSAKDSWIMAILTFGEGYHNFHHYFQADYRNGIRWYHFDPTKWLIQSLNKVGLTYRLRHTSDEKIVEAKMEMKLKTIKSKLPSNEKIHQEIEAMKVRVLEAMREFHELKDQYKATKMRELKLKMKEARAEFHARQEAWNSYIAQLRMTPALANS